MRWFWIDRYIEFEAGVQATAVKAVTLAEDHLHDHFPGAPVMPSSLILEGLAQTGGLLVAQQHDFLRNVVLAKVSRAQFHLPAFPGDTLRYHAKIENLKLEGASVSLTSHLGDRLQAEADVFFAYVDEIAGGQHLFSPEGFANWLRLLRLFEVGRYPDGRPLAPPPMLQETLWTSGESVASSVGLRSAASDKCCSASSNGAATSNGTADEHGGIPTHGTPTHGTPTHSTSSHGASSHSAVGESR